MTVFLGIEYKFSLTFSISPPNVMNLENINKFSLISSKMEKFITPGWEGESEDEIEIEGLLTL